MCQQPEPTTKAAKKQISILTNAMMVFAKEGFRNTDVQIIADLAGVGKGTVYRHFGNKEQLFLATAKFCVERMSDYARRKVLQDQEIPDLIETNGVPQLLRKIMLACAEYYQKHPQSIEIMIQERAEFRESVYPTHLMFREENRSGLDGIMQAGIDRGELRAINVMQASDAFTDLLFGCMISGCLQGQKGKLVERVESAIDLLLNGLVATDQPAKT